MLVIGIGNELRSDDGAGIEVARRLRRLARHTGIEVCELLGEPTQLLEAWEGRDAVVLVDTMHSGAPAGTIARFDVSRAPLPVPFRGLSSTHAFSIDQTIELGRALDRLPETVIFFAVEGRTFEAGSGLSEKLEAMIPSLADAVLIEAEALSR